MSNKSVIRTLVDFGVELMGAIFSDKDLIFRRELFFFFFFFFILLVGARADRGHRETAAK